MDSGLSGGAASHLIPLACGSGNNTTKAHFASVRHDEKRSRDASGSPLKILCLSPSDISSAAPHVTLTDGGATASSTAESSPAGPITSFPVTAVRSGMYPLSRRRGGATAGAAAAVTSPSSGGSSTCLPPATTNGATSTAAPSLHYGDGEEHYAQTASSSHAGAVCPSGYYGRGVAGCSSYDNDVGGRRDYPTSSSAYPGGLASSEAPYGSVYNTVPEGRKEAGVAGEESAMMERQGGPSLTSFPCGLPASAVPQSPFPQPSLYPRQPPPPPPLPQQQQSLSLPPRTPYMGPTWMQHHEMYNPQQQQPSLFQYTPFPFPQNAGGGEQGYYKAGNVPHRSYARSAMGSGGGFHHHHHHHFQQQQQQQRLPQREAYQQGPLMGMGCATYPPRCSGGNAYQEDRFTVPWNNAALPYGAFDAVPRPESQPFPLPQSSQVPNQFAQPSSSAVGGIGQGPSSSGIPFPGGHASTAAGMVSGVPPGGHNGYGLDKGGHGTHGARAAHQIPFPFDDSSTPCPATVRDLPGPIDDAGGCHADCYGGSRDPSAGVPITSAQQPEGTASNVVTRSPITQIARRAMHGGDRDGTGPSSSTGYHATPPSNSRVQGECDAVEDGSVPSRHPSQDSHDDHRDNGTGRPDLEEGVYGDRDGDASVLQQPPRFVGRDGQQASPTGEALAVLNNAVRGRENESRVDGPQQHSVVRHNHKDVSAPLEGHYVTDSYASKPSSYPLDHRASEMDDVALPIVSAGGMHPRRPSQSVSPPKGAVPQDGDAATGAKAGALKVLFQEGTLVPCDATGAAADAKGRRSPSESGDDVEGDKEGPTSSHAGPVRRSAGGVLEPVTSGRGAASGVTREGEGLIAAGAHPASYSGLNISTKSGSGQEPKLLQPQTAHTPKQRQQRESVFKSEDTLEWRDRPRLADLPASGAATNLKLRRLMQQSGPRGAAREDTCERGRTCKTEERARIGGERDAPLLTAYSERMDEAASSGKTSLMADADDAGSEDGFAFCKGGQPNTAAPTMDDSNTEVERTGSSSCGAINGNCSKTQPFLRSPLQAMRSSFPPHKCLCGVVERKAAPQRDSRYQHVEASLETAASNGSLTEPITSSSSQVEGATYIPELHTAIMTAEAPEPCNAQPCDQGSHGSVCLAHADGQGPSAEDDEKECTTAGATLVSHRKRPKTARPLAADALAEAMTNELLMSSRMPPPPASEDRPRHLPRFFHHRSHHTRSPRQLLTDAYAGAAAAAERSPSMAGSAKANPGACATTSFLRSNSNTVLLTEVAGIVEDASEHPWDGYLHTRSRKGSGAAATMQPPPKALSSPTDSSRHRRPTEQDSSAFSSSAVENAGEGNDRMCFYKSVLQGGVGITRDVDHGIPVSPAHQGALPQELAVELQGDSVGGSGHRVRGGEPLRTSPLTTAVYGSSTFQRSPSKGSFRASFGGNATQTSSTPSPTSQYSSLQQQRFISGTIGAATSPHGGSQHSSAFDHAGPMRGSRRYSPCPRSTSRKRYDHGETAAHGNGSQLVFHASQPQPSGRYGVSSKRMSYLYEHHVGQELLLEEYNAGLSLNAGSFGNVACLVRAISPQAPVMGELEFPSDEDRCQLLPPGEGIPSSPSLAAGGLAISEVATASAESADGGGGGSQVGIIGSPVDGCCALGSGAGSSSVNGDGHPAAAQSLPPPSFPPPRSADADATHYWGFTGPSYSEPIIALKSIWQSFDHPFGCVIRLAEPIFPAPMRPAEDELVYTPLLSGFRIRFHPASSGFKRLAALREVRRQRHLEEVEGERAKGGRAMTTSAEVKSAQDSQGTRSGAGLKHCYAEEDGVLAWSAATRPNDRNIIGEQIAELARCDESYAELLTGTTADIDHQSWVALMWQPVFCGGHSAKHSCGTFLAFYLLRPPRHLFAPFADKSEGAAMNSSWQSPAFRGDRAALSFDIWALQRRYHIARRVSSPPITQIIKTLSVGGEDEDDHDRGSSSCASASRGRVSWEEGDTGCASTRTAGSLALSANGDSRQRVSELYTGGAVATVPAAMGGGATAAALMGHPTTTTSATIGTTAAPVGSVRIPLIGLIPNRCRSDVWFKPMFDSALKTSQPHQRHNNGVGFPSGSGMRGSEGAGRSAGGTANGIGGGVGGGAGVSSALAGNGESSPPYAFHAPVFLMVAALQLMCWDAFHEWEAGMHTSVVIPAAMEAALTAASDDAVEEAEGTGIRAVASGEAPAHNPLTALIEETMEGMQPPLPESSAGKGAALPASCASLKGTGGGSPTFYAARGVELMTEAARQYRSLREAANLDAVVEEGAGGGTVAAVMEVGPAGASAANAEKRRLDGEESATARPALPSNGALVGGGTNSALCDPAARVIVGLLDYYQWAQYDASLTTLASSYCTR